MRRLVAHADAPGPSGLLVSADAWRRAGGGVAVAFRLDGALDVVRVPPPGPAAIAWALWAHTCFETFVALADRAGYHEFNLAPSRAWAAHAFPRHRDGGPVDDPALAPGIEVERTGNALGLRAVLPLERLSGEHARTAVDVGLTAVIEDTAGRLSYWSLTHPPGPPDFHHQRHRVLRLEAPGGPCEEGPS